MEYEEILNRMLKKIPDSIDKREGSIIYNALAPAALELAQMYFQIENNTDLIFADTAVEKYLDRICEQNGLLRKQATNAIRKGLFYDSNNDYMNVEINTRFSSNSIVYRAVEQIEKGIYKLECETAGTEGNTYTGELIPVQYIEGLAKVELADILIPRRRYRNR